MAQPFNATEAAQTSTALTLPVDQGGTRGPSAPIQFNPPREKTSALVITANIEAYSLQGFLA